MLRHIHIRNFAIIDELDLDLSAGMSALTGETGAGKSILIDALGLLLGDRADSGTVKHGASKADITAEFDLVDLEEARAWLEELDLEQDGECLIRRVIGSDGRSKAYINGTPSNLSQLKALGSLLVEIHGQHEHQSLMKREIQRKLLDSYGENQKDTNAVQKAFSQWSSLQQHFTDLSTNQDERQRHTDMLRYQVEELHRLEPQENEWQQLAEEHDRLAHAGQLLETTQQACNVLYESDEQSLYALLSGQIHALEEACRIDSSLETALEMLRNAQINTQEAQDELRRYADRIDMDPARLKWLEQRLASFKELSRKHHCNPEDLPATLEQLSQELGSLDTDENDLEKLEQQLNLAAEQYLEAARKLHEHRTRAARRLSKGISDTMQGLGMQGGQFDVSVEWKEEAGFAAHGLDRVEFQVSANPGQPLKPLTKVASGGELARISLAIQMLATENLSIPTLIFDEVDSGIGGAVAEIVGKLLRQLGDARQVLCVTHLPQVAAQAHHHFMVEKSREADQTSTAIRVLEMDQRIEEVARMLGGIEMTDQTIAHASEMLDRAREG
jgi:DNA repair protein RecN (Recombination protein N)